MNMFQSDPVPLYRDETGSIRISNTRVLLELVIRAFQDGATPEEIVQRYSTLQLADVYAVITFYLRHRKEVEDYLQEQEEAARKIRQEIEQDQPDLSHIRERIARIRQERQKNAPAGE